MTNTAHHNNRILRRLPRHEYDLLRNDLSDASVDAGDTLWWPGDAVEHVCFPEDCVISIVQTYRSGDQYETASVGCEGLVCLPALLGAHDRSQMLYRAQVGGVLHRIARERLVDAMDALPALRAAVHSYAAGFAGSALISVSCNRAHPVEQRLARWLLMTADRTRKEELPLTHEVLAVMVGVQRPTVTIAAGALERRGLIRYARGRLTIIDRQGLEGAACECYHLSADVLPANC